MIQTTAIGRLVKDPTLDTTPSGKPVCKLRIACDKAGAKKGTNYLDITIWNGAEHNHKYLAKGRQIAVSGTLEHSQWKTDGNYHERYELVANQVTWLSRPGGKNGEDAK